MVRTARLPGFRPGKAPAKIIAQRFGRQVRNEVVDEITRSSFYDAIMQEKLRPAGTPNIEPVEVKPGEGLSYTAVFDVFPEMAEPSLESLEIVRPQAEVADADVERMLTRLQTQRKTWTAVERSATAMIGSLSTSRAVSMVRYPSRHLVPGWRSNSTPGR